MAVEIELMGDDMSTVYYDNINGFSQLKMENNRLYGRLNSGEWTEIETGGEQGEPGADGMSAYVYIAWCSDPSTGAGFSLTTPADYIAFLSTNTQLASPQFSQFSHWAKYIGEDGDDGTSTYVYYAYASDASGTNFSLSPADGLNYQAILVTHTELASPSLADFVGLFYQYKTDLSAYLPLAGGTMTGGITSTVEDIVAKSDNSGRLAIYGGTAYHYGASFYLFGKDQATAPGIFAIYADDGTKYKSLSGFPDGTLTWGGVSVLNPTGTVIAFAGNSAPNGYIICNGAAVSRTTYADLFAIIGTTYGAGNGSTTFNLPNLTDKFIMGSGTAGTVMDAGLPNIVGTLGYVSASAAVGGDIGTGAFENSLGVAGNRGNGTGPMVNVKFSAQNSNAIYGNSTTVQPPALTMRFYIKY